MYEDENDYEPVSFAENSGPSIRKVPKSRNAPQAHGLAALTAQFRSIPGIDKTMQTFRELIVKLSSAKTELERISILIDYTGVGNAP